jgi:hypothetical protein
MKTEFDLRLAYKVDTGVLPVRGDENSLKGDFDFDFDFVNNADPDNEDACDIAAEALDTFNSMKGEVDEILQYLYWLEERLLNFENNKPLKRIRRTR